MAIKSPVYLGSPEDASDRFPWLSDVLDSTNIDAASPRKTVSLLPFIDFASPWESEAEVLAFSLPAHLAASASQLATASLTALNFQSADLLASRTLLAIESDHVTLQFPALALPTHFPSIGIDTFYIAVVSGEQLAVVKHEQCSEDMESLLVGLQACCLCSGINYKPYRIWPEEVLAAHQGLQDQDDDKIVDCTVVSHPMQRSEPCSKTLR